MKRPSASASPAELAAALHEVSNALTVVLGWLDIAGGRAQAGPARDALEVAVSYARLGHGVARRAIGDGDGGLAAERSAAVLARAAVLGITPAAERKGVHVRCESTTSLDDWVAEADAVAQILLNLLLNAVAFSPAGGVVTLTLREGDGGIVFRVIDEGPGIDPERAATLFTAPDSTRPGGTGIGLVHSSAAARERGGQLSLARPGPGACFELFWPKRPERADARPAPEPVRLDGARVLVLEDDPAVLGLIELALEARGAMVISVTSLHDLASFEVGGGLSAALFDLSPIADDPRGAIALLRARAGAVPVVLISGSPTGAPDLGHDDVRAWVRKPFEMGEVLAVLRALLAGG